MKPVLLSFLGINIYSYPLFLGFALASFVLLSENKVKENKIFKVLFYSGLFVSAYLGAKTLFYFINQDSMIFDTSSFILGGGFVFWGGAIAGIVYIFFLSRLNKSLSLDIFVPALAFSHGIGRIGCFLVGCCHGILVQGFQVPVQLLESIFCFWIFYLLTKGIGKDSKLLFYLAFYSVFRFVIEFLRGDTHRGVWGVLSTSQIIALLVLATVLIVKKKKLKT